jgi:hypothetical protein
MRRYDQFGRYTAPLLVLQSRPKLTSCQLERPAQATLERLSGSADLFVTLKTLQAAIDCAAVVFFTR